MKVRLNGWQRLWVILSVLYLLLVVGVTIAFWPTPETTYHRDEFIARMPAELRARVEGAYESRWEWKEAGGKGIVWVYAPPDPHATSPPPGFVSFPNGAVLDIRVAKEHDARAAAAYWDVVESATRADRWTRAWQVTLAWLIPILTLYAFGWAVAWVRRGFAKA